MEQPWTAVDEGLLNGIQLVNHLQDYDRLPSSQSSSPMPLQSGEEYLGVTSSQGLKWTRIRVRPESWSRFRFTVKWARDPLMAPFLWLILLPFNIIFALIARERATQTHEQWSEIGRGYLVITQLALLQSAPGGLIRIPWDKVTAVGLDSMLAGISVTYEAQHFHFKIPPESCPWFYVASRFLAFNERSPTLNVPEDLLTRARFHGRIP